MRVNFTTRAVTTGEVGAVLAAIKPGLPADDRAMHIIRTTCRRDPAFRAEQLWVGEVAGRVVALLLATGGAVRVGRSSLQAIVLVPAVVALDEQSQAACSALVHDSLKRAAAGGIPIALLLGHSWQFPRYGFSPAMKRYRVVMNGDLALPDGGADVIRPAAAAEQAALETCYDAVTAQTSLAALRTGDWEWETGDLRQTVEVVTDAAGMVRGYVRWWLDEGMVRVPEIAALDASSALALSRHLITLAPGGAVVEATPDNLWTRVIWQHGAEVRWANGEGQPLLRVLDLRGLLNALLPELERRIGRSEYAGQRAMLRLETPVGSVGVRIERGRITLDGQARPSVSLPFPVLVALVSGYRGIRDMLGEPGLQIESPASIRLLEVLFPEGYPCWTPAPVYGT